MPTRLLWFTLLLVTHSFSSSRVYEAVYDYANVAEVLQGDTSTDGAASIVLQQNAAYSKSAPTTQQSELQCDTSSVLQLEADHPLEG